MVTKTLTLTIQVMHLPNDRLPKICYKLQRRWTETDIDCWGRQIRNIFSGVGFSDVWLNQGVGHVPHFLKVFETRLLDIDTQTQSSDIQDLDTLRTYKLLKHNFVCEEYMFCIVNKILRTAFSRFRGGLLSLACNEGHYDNTPFVKRLCPLCKNGTCIETKFHFLLVCPYLSQIKFKYI